MVRESIVGLMPSISVSSARLSGPRIVVMPSTEAWVGVRPSSREAALSCRASFRTTRLKRITVSLSMPGAPWCASVLLLQMIGQPGVHLADAVGQQGEMAVVVEQPGLHAGDAVGEPAAVPERDELVLAAVHEQHGDADSGQLEPPRAAVGHAVIPPPLAARRQALAAGPGEILRELAGQGGRVGRRQQRLPQFGQVAGTGGYGLVAVLLQLGAGRVRIAFQQLEVVDVLLAHAVEPV